MPDQRLRDVMTVAPFTLDLTSSVSDAARAMAAHDIGPVPVVDENQRLTGMLTDRDITVRVVACDLDPRTTPVLDVATPEPLCVGSDATVDDALAIMRENAIRRLPVVDEDWHVVGIVSLGDLAQDDDSQTALEDISNAPPND